MKKLIIALTTLIFIGGSVLAQESQTIKFKKYNDEQINTVFKKHKKDGFYWSLTTGYTPVDNKHGAFTSARGAWIMDHWFAFGFVGTGLVSNIDNLDNYYINNQSTGGEVSVGAGYGGLLFEPILLPMKPVHLSFPIVAGIGAAGVINDYVYYSVPSSYGDLFYVVEPGVELEVNFTRWLRIALYGSYRYTSEVNIDNFAKDGLRGYSAGVTVKLGLF